MRALLPVITTRRPDRRDRGYLAWVAVAGEVAHLPLETAPIDASTHVLEIYVEGFDEPLVVLADPAGAPDETGFPLRHAVLWDAAGHLTDLKTLPGGSLSAAFGINNHGLVVGTSDGSEGDSRAVAWEHGRVVDLNALLPSNSPWRLTTANAVNDRGVIVGSGRIGDETHAFVLVR